MVKYRVWNVLLTSTEWDGAKKEDEPQERVIEFDPASDQEELDEYIEDADGDEDEGLMAYLRFRVMESENPPEGYIDDFEYEVV
jgi:hypothetical protein